MVGADTTFPATTMASCLVGHTGLATKHWTANALNRSMPSAPGRSTGSTVHLSSGVTLARADCTTDPSTSLGPSSYHWDPSVPGTRSARTGTGAVPGTGDAGGRFWSTGRK